MIGSDFLLPIEIRTATTGDIGAMALVLDRANAKRDGLPLPQSVGEGIEDDIRTRMSRPESWAYVGMDSKRVTGFVLGYPTTGETTPATDHSVEYLALLMTDPDFWGHHIASRLLDTAATHARRLNRSGLVLWTGQFNNRARQVYEHKGYRLTEKTRISEHRGPQVQYLLDL